MGNFLCPSTPRQMQEGDLPLKWGWRSTSRGGERDWGRNLSLPRRLSSLSLRKLLCALFAYPFHSSHVLLALNSNGYYYSRVTATLQRF